MMAPSVVVVGSGNMSFHLCSAFVQAKIPLRQILNHTRRGLSSLASITNAPVSTDFTNVDRGADIYIIAVKDDAIIEVVQKLSGRLHKNAIIVHTSGGCSIDVLASEFTHYGAFYPLQSFKKERSVQFSEIPIFISSNSSHTSNRLISLADSISKKVIEIPDKQRIKLHLPAVLVNNFVHHLFTLSQEYCRTEKLPFEHLLPLIQETFDRIKKENDLKILQTGPAIRGDIKTISKHREILTNYPHILRLYNYLSRHIKEYYANN